MRHTKLWVAILTISVVSVLLASGCGGKKEKQYHGIGPTVTLPFTMEGPWQLRCTYQGGFMRILVLDEYGAKTNMTFSHQGGGEALFTADKAGTYSLEVQTNDDTNWQITIFEP